MTQIDERECQAHLLTSSDGGPERWTCPKCGPNITGPCQIDERKVEEALVNAVWNAGFDGLIIEECEKALNPHQ